MAYDELLAERLRTLFSDYTDIDEKKMFGGLCFLINGNMLCGIVGETLMARVGKEQYDECLLRPHAREMDFTGRSMKGLVYISPEGFETDEELQSWIDSCIAFAGSLPPK